MPRQTTFLTKEQALDDKQWRHIDADGQVLGRLATRVAVVLMGKHRPDWTPHVDCGDFVVVTNASGVIMTGRKPEQKVRTHFTGYPGGLRSNTYKALLSRRPEFVVEEAVRRMLPKGRLGRRMLKKLKVYSGSAHPHQAQSPVELA